MAGAARPRHEHAHGGLRARGAARRRGDDDERPLPVARVTFYSAPGCELCARALEVVQEARPELDFELEVVDVSRDPELESRYRELLPVVEIDGVRAFTYFVEPDAFRARLSG